MQVSINSDEWNKEEEADKWSACTYGTVLFYLICTQTTFDTTSHTGGRTATELKLHTVVSMHTLTHDPLEPGINTLVHR